MTPKQLSEKFEIDEEYASELISAFNSTVAAGPWLVDVSYLEAGAYTISPRDCVLEAFVDARLNGIETDIFRNYRGFKNFTESKQYCIKFLSSWINELKGSLWELRRLKKLKR